MSHQLTPLHRGVITVWGHLITAAKMKCYYRLLCLCLSNGSIEKPVSWAATSVQVVRQPLSFIRLWMDLRSHSGRIKSGGFFYRLCKQEQNQPERTALIQLGSCQEAACSRGRYQVISVAGHKVSPRCQAARSHRWNMRQCDSISFLSWKKKIHVTMWSYVWSPQQRPGKTDTAVMGSLLTRLLMFNQAKSINRPFTYISLNDVTMKHYQESSKIDCWKQISQSH